MKPPMASDSNHHDARAHGSSLQRFVSRQWEGVLLINADCNEWLASLPECFRVDSVITDPPYGVELKAKRAKQRGGGMTVREGQYNHDDTPEYVRSSVVPAIEAFRKIAACVVVTPGVRNLWAYPAADDLGGFFSAAGTGCSKWGFSCLQPILYYGKDPYLARSMGSRANSCGQTYPNDANKQPHPCAKPIAMMRWLVARASHEGQTVCDPFMGSGTTGVAAIQGCRKFIGIEKDPKHYQTACERIDRVMAQGVLLPANTGKVLQ